MDRLHSYPKVYALGHPAIADLLKGPVAVQEKVDGSQFTFGLIGGELLCRSHGADINVSDPPGLFAPAVETAKRLHAAGLLVEGWQYRAEAVYRPKHNTIAYSRAPAGGMILFDVDTGLEKRLPPDEMVRVAEALGLEHVPTYLMGEVADVEGLKAWLDRESVLGGAKIEGVVLKNYARWNDKDGKMLMGKYVSEAFKETHRTEWRKSNPTRSDIVEELIARYCIPARWEKSIQHLREDGALTDSPKDIGPLMKAIGNDILAECKDEIVAALFRHFWPQIQRGSTRGLPQWYKDRLAERQFAPDAAA